MAPRTSRLVLVALTAVALSLLVILASSFLEVLGVLPRGASARPWLWAPVFGLLALAAGCAVALGVRSLILSRSRQQ